MNKFIQSCINHAISNSPLQFDVANDGNKEDIIYFCLEHKIESVLEPLFDDLSELFDLNARVYTAQKSWLERVKPVLQQIPTFTLIQGFARNGDFAPFMPPGRRSDIDFCVSDKDSDITEAILRKLGLMQTAWIGSKRVELDANETKELEREVGYAYPKQIPFTLPISFEVGELNGFELDEAFGALRTFGDDTVLLVIMERTYSFGDDSARIFIDGRHRVYNDGIFESDDHLFALAAALRLVKGTLNQEPRFRAALEFIHTLAHPKFELDPRMLTELAKTLNLSEVLAQACGLMSRHSDLADRLIRSHGLPSLQNGALEEAFNDQICSINR